MEAIDLTSISQFLETRDLVPGKYLQFYLHWIRRFLQCPTANRPELSKEDALRSYVDALNRDPNVRDWQVEQAERAARLYLFTFLEKELGDMSHTVRAKRGRKLPVVFTQSEIAELFRQVEGTRLLMLQLIYGGGLRLSELTRLRVKDIDFENGLLYVRSGKGDKDRTTLLPQAVIPALKDHLTKVKRLHEEDLDAGAGEVYLPDALFRKYPNVVRELSPKADSPLDMLAS